MAIFEDQAAAFARGYSAVFDMLVAALRRGYGSRRALVKAFTDSR